MIAATGARCACSRPSQRQTSASAQGNDDVLLLQSQADADRKSAGCLTCHTATDSPTMHATGTVRLGCTDCHGGNSEARVGCGPRRRIPPSIRRRRTRRIRSPAIPKQADAHSSANPERAYTKWLRENWDYVRFVNPGDLRVAEKTCGTSGCHTAEVRKVQISMMTHGAMLWGAALYNNGAVPLKTPHFGESYGRDGTPQRLMTFPPPTPEEISKKGILPYLDPLQRWEISQPGNVLRVFERGGKAKPEVGNPSLDEDPGKPEIKLSSRGFGTELRTDPVFLGLQKDAPARSAALVSRHQRSARRLPRQRMQRLPRHLRQRPFAGAFGRVRDPRQSGADRNFRSHDSA